VDGIGRIAGEAAAWHDHDVTGRTSKIGRPTADAKYQPPPPAGRGMIQIADLIRGARAIPSAQQHRLGFDVAEEASGGIRLFYAGDLELARRRSIAIVGTRKVSVEGAKRARRLAREAARAGVVVVSGLAKGVDAEALNSAIEAGGKTIAVIGTPLNQAYPAENKRLQELIYREHLLLSQFEDGTRVFPSNFPQRNRVMAAVSDATAIIEASDTSGTLHQAAECQRLGRWLFIAKSVVEDKTLSWPAKFLSYPRTRVLSSTADLLETLGVGK
jgi:DNA processing protein